MAPHSRGARGTTGPSPSRLPPDYAHHAGIDNMIDEEAYISEYDDSDIVGDIPDHTPDEYDDFEEGEEDPVEDAEDDKGEAYTTAPLPCPPNLRDIGALASWTASSSKQGCTTHELKAPNTNLFWQSDGPLPHHLNIHFPKIVDVVAIRLFLDHDRDESYTPITVEWHAGMGYYGLAHWGTSTFNKPTGWFWADMSGVDDSLIRRARKSKKQLLFDPMAEFPLGHDPKEEDLDEEEVECSSDDEDDGGDGDGNNNNTDNAPKKPNRRRIRRPLYPVLRCMLLQLRVVKNHQEGKDTHLRGLQIFSRETRQQKRDRLVVAGAAGVANPMTDPAGGSAPVPPQTRGRSQTTDPAALFVERLRAQGFGGFAPVAGSSAAVPTPGQDGEAAKKKPVDISWMRIPDLR